MAGNAGDDQDIEAWLASLAGRSPQANDDREAQALRRAVLARAEASASALDPTAETAAWERLRFRLRRDNLVGSAAPRRARVWLPAAAAAVLVLGVAVTYWGRQSDDLSQIAVVDDAAPVFRGGPEPFVATVADPAQAARRVALALKRQQVQATVYVQPGQAVVDFEAEAAMLPTVQEAVRSQLPAAVLRPGINRLVFRKG
jgi:hypothetical protein